MSVLISDPQILFVCIQIRIILLPFEVIMCVSIYMLSNTLFSSLLVLDIDADTGGKTLELIRKSQ